LDVAVFLIVGIAIYHFTIVGKWFALTFFLITAIVMTALIVDYIQRRHILVSHGLQVRYTVDVLAVSNILTLGVLIWIIWTVLNEDEPMPVERVYLSRIDPMHAT